MFRHEETLYHLPSPSTTTYRQLLCVLRVPTPNDKLPTLQLSVCAITAPRYKSFIRTNENHKRLLKMHVGSDEVWGIFLSIVEEMVTEARDKGEEMKGVGVEWCESE